MLAKLKSIYDSLSPTTKKKISLLIAAGFVIFVGLSVYKIGDNKSSQSHPSGTVKQINLDPKLVQNTIYEETRKKTSEMERRQKELEKHQEETNQKIDQLISKLEVNSIVNASPHGPVSVKTDLEMSAVNQLRIIMLFPDP